METETTSYTATTLYTGTTGTTCYLAGQRGTVTGLHTEHGQIVGAFVALEGPTDGQGRFIAPGPMVYVTLSSAAGAGRHVVAAWRVIDRDEFDRINTLDKLRADLGWR